MMIKTFSAKTGSPFLLMPPEASLLWLRPGGTRAVPLAEITDPAHPTCHSGLWQAESHLPACPRLKGRIPLASMPKFMRPNEFHTSVYPLLETLLQEEFSMTQKRHSQNQACCVGSPQSTAHTNQRVTAENPLYTAITQLLIFPGEFGPSQPAQLPTLTSQDVNPGPMAA